MRADLIPIASSWLLTYLLHSTLLLGGVWLVTRLSTTPPAVRDLLWKAALVGGFATATLQVGLGFEPLGGAVSLELGRAAARLPTTTDDQSKSAKAANARRRRVGTPCLRTDRSKGHRGWPCRTRWAHS